MKQRKFENTGAVSNGSTDIYNKCTADRHHPINQVNQLMSMLAKSITILFRGSGNPSTLQVK